MYEHMTYEYILERMLSRVPDVLDKREGSVIYDACAPAAMELAQFYIELDTNYILSFADTASGEYLTRRTAEFGVNRNSATYAQRKALFYSESNELMDIPLGSRFSIGELTYRATERYSLGIYKLTCEQLGTSGNERFGEMLPIDYVANLAKAQLMDVFVPGEDEEEDERLRARFYEAVNEPAFGGNVADYKQKVNSISGVGATKVYPVWNGSGTVKCTIIAADWLVPSNALINEVQTIIDPIVNQGQGFGQAPIDHTVTIAGVTTRTINVSLQLSLESGVNVSQIQEAVEEAIAAYLLELRKDWSNQKQLTVRIAQLDARLLTIQGVEDVSGTLINQYDTNEILNSDEIPVLGVVSINA